VHNGVNTDSDYKYIKLVRHNPECEGSTALNVHVEVFWGYDTLLQ